MFHKATAASESDQLDPRVRRLIIQTSGLTALAVIMAYGSALLLGKDPPSIVQEYAGFCLIAVFLIGAVLTFAHIVRLLLAGEGDPLPKVTLYVRKLVTLRVLAQRVLPIVLLFTFLGAFTVLKTLITRIHPFAWDAVFSDLDRAIFGTDPWRLTHALIGREESRWLDFIYCTWLPVFTAVVLYHSVIAPIDRQRRFFLSIFGMWILLGLVAATIFSSAGPCFLELLHHPYAIRYRGIPTADFAPFSVEVIRYLAKEHFAGSISMGTGISAMPSLHVGVAFLYALLARKSWTLAIAYLYWLLIFIGSVHIGWHYAVDGIAGTVGMWVIWRLTAARETAEAQRKIFSEPIRFRHG